MAHCAAPSQSSSSASSSARPEGPYDQPKAGQPQPALGVGGAESLATSTRTPSSARSAAAPSCEEQQAERVAEQQKLRHREVAQEEREEEGA